MIKAPQTYTSEEITALFAQAARDDVEELFELRGRYPQFKPATSPLASFDEDDEL